MKGIENERVVGVSAYASPHCFVMEFSSEGILCISGLYGGVDHDGIYGEDNPLI